MCGQQRKDLELESWGSLPTPHLSSCLSPLPALVLTCWLQPRSRPRWNSWGRELAGGLRTPKLEADAEMNHRKVGLGGGGEQPRGWSLPGLLPPALAPALHSWKLTHDPHHDVPQNEEKEEDTADDICAAPGREVGKSFGEGTWGVRAGGVTGWRVGTFYFISLRYIYFILRKPLTIYQEISKKCLFPFVEAGGTKEQNILSG